ncbi:cyclophilin-like fold protein [Deinococcus sp. UYEF24]
MNPTLPGLMLAGLSLTSLTPSPLAQTSLSDTNAMKITLKIGRQTLKATMRDGAAAHDFLSLLPLTLRLEDHAGTEKIAFLPRSLTTKNAPAGSTPASGDIAYYAPWGNLALFHKDFGYSSGLIILGKLEGDVNVLRQLGGVSVIIEREK